MMKIVVCKKSLWDYSNLKSKGFLHSANSRFDNWFTKEWLNDPVCEQMVRDIDKTEHIKDYLYDSPRLGGIGPERLSGGVKGLMLIYKDLDGPREYLSGIWGDNCIPWLVKLSHICDFTFVLEYLHVWRDVTGLNAITEDGRPITTGKELLKYVAEMRS